MGITTVIVCHLISRTEALVIACCINGRYVLTCFQRQRYTWKASSTKYPHVSSEVAETLKADWRTMHRFATSYETSSPQEPSSQPRNKRRIQNDADHAHYRHLIKWTERVHPQPLTRKSADSPENQSALRQTHFHSHRQTDVRLFGMKCDAMATKNYIPYVTYTLRSWCHSTVIMKSVWSSNCWGTFTRSTRLLSTSQNTNCNSRWDSLLAKAPKDGVTKNLVQSQPDGNIKCFITGVRQFNTGLKALSFF